MIKHIRKWLEWRKGNTNHWSHKLLVLLHMRRSLTFDTFITKADWKGFASAIEIGIGAMDLFSESAKLAEQSLQNLKEAFSMSGLILYLCDQKACAEPKGCQTQCFHTTDIAHAVNFRRDNLEGSYWKEASEIKSPSKETGRTLSIVFMNGTSGIVENVTEYGVNELDFSCFWFVRDGTKNFIPREHVVFFGPALMQLVNPRRRSAVNYSTPPLSNRDTLTREEFENA